MRLHFHVLLAFLSVLAAPSPAAAGAFADWTEPRADTSLMLLLTGGDAGFVKPKGCFKGVGGSLYRPGFDAWLSAREGMPPHLWLSTGDILTTFDEEGVATPEAQLDNLARTGISGLGFGRGDFDVLGVPQHSERLPWIATNLEIFETGAPALPRSLMIERAGLTIGVLAVSPHRPGAIGGDLERGSIVSTEGLAAIRREMDAWSTQPDYVVVLAPLRQAAVRTLAAGLSGVDLVVASSALLARPEVETVGETPVLWVGGWGRFLGRVELSREGDAHATTVIEVGPRFPIDPMTGREPGAPLDKASR